MTSALRELCGPAKTVALSDYSLAKLAAGSTVVQKLSQATAYSGVKRDQALRGEPPKTFGFSKTDPNIKRVGQPILPDKALSSMWHSMNMTFPSTFSRPRVMTGSRIAERMPDPIEQRKAFETQTVDINKTDTISGGGTYLGTVVFDGSHWAGAADRTSKIYGNTTVHNGTLALKNGVTYSNTSTDAGWGKFTVGAAATLFSDATGNTITANEIILESGSTLAFDLTGAANDGTTTNLVLDNTTVAFADAPSKIDIHAFNGTGTFNLAKITGTGGGTFADPSAIVPTMHGQSLTGTRADGKVSVHRDGTNTILQLTNTAANGIVTWTGAVDSNWNTTTKNWDTTQVDGGTSNQFLHGDAVVFNTAGPHNVAIQNDGVTIAAQGANPGMEIAAGDWTFTGGEIFGSEISFTGTGSLTLGGVNGGTTREVHQRITTNNWVTSTVNVVDGVTVVFADKSSTSSGGAISAYNFEIGSTGTTGGAFVFRDNKAEANAAYAGNGGAISTAVALTLKDADYTFSGNSASSTVAGFGWGGAICAFGALEFADGTYDFTENKASSAGGAVYAFTTLKFADGTGTTTQSGGTLNLAAAASISTDFVQNSGTLKTTNGETLNTATFKGTVMPTGTLNVTSATFDGATVKLSPDLTTDKIVASGRYVILTMI